MNRNLRFVTCLLAAASLSALGLAGCNNPNTAENAGRKVDQAVAKIGNKAEQAGQKIENKMEQVAQGAREKSATAGQALDDAGITAAVKAGILAEPGLKVLKIDVDTVQGIVTLTGSADSTQNVEKAGQVASAVQGVKSGDNRVAVSSKG